jgi:hypothetical protein
MQDAQPPAVVLESIEPSQQLPQSPTLPAGRPGLAIEVLPASNRGRPTYAVLGTVRLTVRQSQLYGPDADQVLRLVAYDPRSGRVLHADLAGAHAPPLGQSTHFEPPPPPRAPDGAILPTTFGFNFNVDALGLLNPPADAAVYTLVAWIEDLVSDVRTIAVTEDKARFPGPPVLVEPSVSSPINVRRDPRSPPQVRDTISAVGTPPADDPQRNIGRVLVSIGPGVLPSVPEGVEGAPKHVAIIAQTALDRKIAVRTVRLPGVVFDATGAGEFDFEAADLFPPDTRRQPVFVLVLGGQRTSKPVTLVPPGWKD